MRETAIARHLTPLGTLANGTGRARCNAAEAGIYLRLKRNTKFTCAVRRVHRGHDSSVLRFVGMRDQDFRLACRSFLIVHGD